MTSNRVAAAQGAPPEEVTNEKDEAQRVKSAKVIDGAVTICATKAAHRRIDQSLGTASSDFQAYCITQLLNLLPEPGSEDHTVILNAALAMLSAINPKDELEAMLAVQMVASNHMALLCTRRVVHGQTIEQRQYNGNLATKFSRTFVAQMEALGKHRRGGKQIVEHVHVNAGGQAVIAGTVNTGRGA